MLWAIVAAKKKNDCIGRWQRSANRAAGYGPTPGCIISR
jgi:hypothetical protein